MFKNDTPIHLTFSRLKRHRLLQIIGFTLFGLILAMAVATGTIQQVVAGGCLALVIAGAFALKHNTGAASNILLWSLALMLSLLAINSGGIRDLAMIGFPGLLFYAAVLGSMRLFFSLLIYVVALCSALAWLTLNDIFHPYIPPLGWQHLVFINVIMLIIGFSVFLMVRDMHNLARSLQHENEKVRASKKEIERLAQHDSLTGLPNRSYGEQLYHTLLMSCLHHQQKLAVLFLDLDSFKPINDSMGHAAGDQLLQALAQRLTGLLGENEQAVRFGSDEFLLLIPYPAETSRLQDLSAQLIDRIRQPFSVMQTDVEVSASIGIAQAPDDGTEFSALCRKADLAMYKAKQDGRNRVVQYDDKLDQANVNKFNLLQKLRQAVKDQEFVLYYQPKIDLQDGHITSVEALLRWPQADGSMISPADFIPLAEQSGLIVDLSEWVLQEACVACRRMREQGLPDLRMAVNLSYVQFKNVRLEQSIKQALRDAGLAANALELELTESLLMDDTELVQRQLQSLNRLGTTVAIDDFGTGYSNLSYLRSFNAATLKIDRSFVSSLSLSPRDTPLVQAIINMARSLGLKTVAEGVEDAATAEQLRQMGCDEGQGYYWSPAVSEQRLLQQFVVNDC